MFLKYVPMCRYERYLDPDCSHGQATCHLLWLTFPWGFDHTYKLLNNMNTLGAFLPCVYTQLAQPQTKSAEHLRPFAK